MKHPPPRPTLFPYTTLFRSLPAPAVTVSYNGRASPRSPETRSDAAAAGRAGRDRKSTRLNSSHSQISYAVFCLKKKTDVQMQDGDAGSVSQIALHQSGVVGL